MKTSFHSIRTDIRSFENPADMYGHCRKCGHSIVVLPDDRRFGYCFDCLDFLWVSKKTEVGDGRAFIMPPENGFSMY